MIQFPWSQCFVTYIANQSSLKIAPTVPLGSFEKLRPHYGILLVHFHRGTKPGGRRASAHKYEISLASFRYKFIVGNGVLCSDKATEFIF